MRNEENIGHIVRDKSAMASLSLTGKIDSVCYLEFIKGNKKTRE